jgi:hypothetical protein
MSDEVSNAIDEVRSLSGQESDLWRPVLDLLPVSGASISTIADYIGTETVAASDAIAARIDELQFDLGEGPCWEALRSAQPVLEPEIRTRPKHAWPAFSDAIAEVEVGALFAFPLIFGPLKLGAMDLYTESPSQLSVEQTSDGTALAAEISRIVLSRAVRLSSTAAEADDSLYSRRVVHQATGVVIAQLDIGAEDARLLIHAHAFATERTVRDVADDILQRTLDFSKRHNSIGSSDD